MGARFTLESLDLRNSSSLVPSFDEVTFHRLSPAHLVPPLFSGTATATDSRDVSPDVDSPITSTTTASSSAPSFYDLCRQILAIVQQVAARLPLDATTPSRESTTMSGRPDGQPARDEEDAFDDDIADADAVAGSDSAAGAAENEQRRESDSDSSQVDLARILRFLLRTGQVRFMAGQPWIDGTSRVDMNYEEGIGYGDDDDDSDYVASDDANDSDSDDNRVVHQPEPDPAPDLQRLQSSDLMQEILQNSGRGPLSNISTCCIPKPSLRCLAGNYLVSTRTMSAANSAQDIPRQSSSTDLAFDPSDAAEGDASGTRAVGCVPTCFGRFRKRAQAAKREEEEAERSKRELALKRQGLQGSVGFRSRPFPVVLRDRELGLRGARCKTSRGIWMLGDCSAISSMFLPNKPSRVAEFGRKAFCGSYSTDGCTFLSACQDNYIRAYDCRNGHFKEFKKIQARDVGWSVLDTAFSPDGLYFIYSSWSPSVHICNIYGDSPTQIALDMRPGEHRFACFSIRFSMDNREIMAGANDGAIYIYDREASMRTLCIHAHEDDVNTVSFADATSQILFSGGDDGLVKVWDRRMLDDERAKPVGVLTGHTDGVTFVDSKGDGRYLISNGKDQCVKLWDIRRFGTQDGVDQVRKAVSKQNWDYRWQPVPKKNMKRVKINGDVSIMTYRGHGVLSTLIRCYFSPEFTTGQRFIYSGCSTGRVVIWDILTGRIAKRLHSHRQCVRDVSWHPYENKIVSTSWDGSLCQWEYAGDDDDEIVGNRDKPGRDKGNKYSLRSREGSNRNAVQVRVMY